MDLSTRESEGRTQVYNALYVQAIVRRAQRTPEAAALRRELAERALQRDGSHDYAHQEGS